jgi:hypothetical protein
MNGQKTGGRQKGTPNKITASAKYMFKALMMNNYDLVEDSFQKAKPNERLNFIAKMTPFICAKEQPGKNGGEWVMDQSMDHEWFQMYESDHLLRRKQRIEHEENYAIQDINSQYSYEWQMIHDVCAQFNRLGMDGEDVKQMIYKRVDEFFNEQRNDKNRVRENFQQRRDNFMKIEQEFFNEQDDQEEPKRQAQEETCTEQAEQYIEPAQNAGCQKIVELNQPSDGLNNSTTSTNPTGEVGGASCPAQSAAEAQRLNPSTLDTPSPSFSIGGDSVTAQSEEQKPSLQKPNIRLLKQQQHRPFYTAIANKRRRH